MSADRDQLIDAARLAAANAHAPYSGFAVGAALAFTDGSTVTAANVENVSYGLSLCAETVAVAQAMNKGHRGGLVAVAVSGPGDTPVTPCGRCRQVLAELAGLDGADPVVWCACGEDEGVLTARLSELLPHGFAPDGLG